MRATAHRMTTIAEDLPAMPEALRRFVAAQPLHRFTDTRGLAWSLRDSGARGDTATAGPRPLVLLPGALGNGDSAWRIAQAFAAERRVLSITYPGGVAPELLALGLEELLRERRTGAVALWASSYGAWWAQAFALRFPDQVAALWLGNTFVDGRDVAQHPLFDAGWLAASDSATVIARWDQALRARPDDLLRAVQLHLLHAGLPASDFHGRLRQVAGAGELPAPQAIANTVVFECEDDAIIAPATRARVRARYPKARHLAQAQGGHYPHIVAAELLVERMRDWLQ